MSETTWLRGAPPAPGWYAACTERDAGMRRYYHAEGWWSAPVHVDDMPLHGARAMATRGESQSDVEWCAEPTCPCEPGKCVASPRGRREGYMSATSDVRCKAPVEVNRWLVGCLPMPSFDATVIELIERLTDCKLAPPLAASLVVGLRAVFDAERIAMSASFRPNVTGAAG